MASSMPAFKRAVDDGPWYRQRWPWFLMLGPAVVVVAGFITLWLALSRPDALVVDDYYKQGLAINQDLRRDHNAARLQVTADIGYDAAAGMLSGTVRTAGKPYDKAVSLSFMHSTQPSKDMRLHARPDAGGRFTIALPLLDTARWQVQIEDQRLDWRLNSIWNWPEEKQIAFAAQK